MLNKIAKHVRNRSLTAAIARQIIRVTKKSPPRNRFNVTDTKEGIVLVSQLAIGHANRSGKERILIIGDDEINTSTLIHLIEKSGYYPEQIDCSDFLNGFQLDNTDMFACIAVANIETKRLTAIAHRVLQDELLNKIPLEYIILPKNEYKYVSNLNYISPILLSKIDPFKIFTDSLKKFEPKCEIIDFMDIFQLLKGIIENKIEGDIAEFGSYKGHSGYLISKTLTALGSDKQLFMFDMFEDFPDEIIGIDYFWNKSHPVSFSEVQSKFDQINNTVLVKGDFTETFKNTEIDKLSMVYIDCDSYRGTKAILEDVYERKLALNGILILEDYGHAPLLGNRLAFHEFFDGRVDCFKFFSHFNGFQVVVKTKDFSGA